MIDHDDVERAFGISLTGDEIDVMDNEFIPNAVSQLQALINRTITPVAIIGETHDVPWGFGQIIRVKNSPVISVEAVRSNGVVVATNNYERSGRAITVYGLYASTISPVVISVDYTAGLSPSDWRYGAIRAVLLARAYRALLQRRVGANANADVAQGVQSLSVEGYSITYTDTGSELTLPGFTDGELAPVSGFRRHVIV